MPLDLSDPVLMANDFRVIFTKLWISKTIYYNADSAHSAYKGLQNDLNTVSRAKTEAKNDFTSGILLLFTPIREVGDHG
jgi:hypothetical protein